MDQETQNKILSNISFFSKSGSNITYTSLYNNILYEKDTTDSMLHEFNSNKKINWKKILSSCVIILSEQSKDLQILMWYVEALTNKYGFKALLFSTNLIDKFIRKFWTTIHPLDSESRVFLFNWYNNKYYNQFLIKHLLHKYSTQKHNSITLSEWMKMSDVKSVEFTKKIIDEAKYIESLHVDINKVIEIHHNLYKFLTEKGIIDISFENVFYVLNVAKKALEFIISEQQNLSNNKHTIKNINLAQDNVEFDDTNQENILLKDQVIQIDTTCQVNVININDQNIVDYVNKISDFMIQKNPRGIATKIILQFHKWFNKDFVDLLCMYSHDKSGEQLVGILKFLELNKFNMNNDKISSLDEVKTKNSKSVKNDIAKSEN